MKLLRTPAAAMVTTAAIAASVPVYAGSSGAGGGAPRGPKATDVAYTSPGPVGPVAKQAANLSKAKKLRKALAGCKREKRKAKRRSCERSARRRFRKTGTTRRGGPPHAPTPEGEGGATTGGGHTPQEFEPGTIEPMPGPTQIATGESIFSAQCAECHGPNGEGVADEGPNLHEMPRAQSIEGVIAQLTTPEGEMPSFDEVLTFKEKEAVADYVTVNITHTAEEAH